MANVGPAGTPTVNINGGFRGGYRPLTPAQVKDCANPATPEWFCDPETGAITGGVIYNLEPCGGVKQIYLTPDGQQTDIEPTGFPCQPGDIEYKSIVSCWTDGSGGYFQKEICRVYDGITLVNETVLWHLPDGTQSETAPTGILIPCEALKEEFAFIDQPVCDPLN